MTKRNPKSKHNPTLLLRMPRVAQDHNPSNPHPINGTGPGFRYTPKTFYLYYVDMSNNLPRVRHFFYPGGNDTIDTTALPDLSVTDLKSRVQEIVNDMFSPNPQNTHLMSARNFNNVQWRKISYACFIVDIPSWKFVVENDHNNEHPMVMSDRAGSYTGNTCFFDGALMNFTDPRLNTQPPIPDTLRGFYAINHMTRNLNGDLLADGAVQDFGFNICFSVPYYNPVGTEEIICVFDPGGENIGPPVGPP